MVSYEIRSNFFMTHRGRTHIRGKPIEIHGLRIQQLGQGLAFINSKRASKKKAEEDKKGEKKESFKR